MRFCFTYLICFICLFISSGIAYSDDFEVFYDPTYQAISIDPYANDYNPGDEMYFQFGDSGTVSGRILQSGVSSLYGEKTQFYTAYNTSGDNWSNTSYQYGGLLSSNFDKDDYELNIYSNSSWPNQTGYNIVSDNWNVSEGNTTLYIKPIDEYGSIMSVTPEMVRSFSYSDNPSMESSNRVTPFKIGDTDENPGLSYRSTVFNQNGAVSNFDPDLPTYVVTHGWQPGSDYQDDDWVGFDQINNMPEVQSNIMNSISNRLTEGGTDTHANIVIFEWEGAYTGGDSDWETKRHASIQARTNADTAGMQLGNHLEGLLGEDYDNDLHFIGHSYGTIVNGQSTKYLEGLNLLDNADDIQFTTLDAPTSAPFGAAPNFNADWFVDNLSENVDYLDNYIGWSSTAFGEYLDGAGLDQYVAYDHSAVGSDFYPDLIENGPNARTANVFTGEEGVFSHVFDDWITPMLTTYDGRPGSDFSDPSSQQLLAAIGPDFTSITGTPIFVDSLAGSDYYTPELFNGIFLAEQSPVSLFYDIDIPLEATLFAFDWMVESAGDGDWFTIHFGSELLWSMSISEMIEGMLFQEILDISDYAGMEKEIYFTLNSVGDSNASFYVGNFEIRGESPVPEPATMLLFGVGLLSLAGVSRKKQ